jgi:aminoglycoside 3-N-acetyltransferase
VGPGDNAIDYNTADDANMNAAIFDRDLQVDAELGVVNETLRQHPLVERSTHPILSFVGINASEALASQSLDSPFGPVAWLADYDGDVLMMGRDHRFNISLHWAEQLAGRKRFVRWALTGSGVAECVNMPGCAQGFERVRGRLGAITRSTSLNAVVLEAIPVRDLLNMTVGWIREDPRALLCDRMGCPRCASVRAVVRVEKDQTDNKP